MTDESPGRSRRIMVLFDEVMERPPEERDAFLREACGDDAGLRRRIEQLIKSSGQAAGFRRHSRQAQSDDSPGEAAGIPESESPPLTPDDPSRASTATVPSVARPAETIGPYRLLQKIGEGGMGEVWRADQSEPIRRRVALKLIKAGMDTKQVIARFEAERQALALMDHPGIAKVFEAGETPRGMPYFAMEYVAGEPITVYCDRQCLSLRERLDLFMQVCEGVQHAHQKGVIHRDLKPSNVLVSVQDGKPVPKIIDFGVAKATTQPLTERTLYTALGMLVGTPEYMSPEQAEMTGLDVDTRTDVYSLGVMLYELLTGTLPFPSRELRKAGLEEIRRRIREVDPPRPSARVRTQGDRTTDTATKRKTEPGRLVSNLKGELDWIVMKALEKDRTRRYATPHELGADVERHLRHEPVAAGPPGAGYRARKFVRRHRLGVTAASLVLVTMLGALAVTTWGLVRARRAEARARREAATARSVTSFLTNMFQSSQPSQAQGRNVTVREVLDQGAKRIRDELQNQPLVQARMLGTVGNVYQSLGLYGKAAPLLEEARDRLGEMLGEDNPATLGARRNLGWLRFHQARFDEAERILTGVLEDEERRRGDDDPVTLGIRAELGYMYMDQGRYEEAQPLMEAALEGRRRVLGDEHIDTVWAMIQLNWLYSRMGRRDEANKLSEESYAIARRKWGDDAPATLVAQMAVGYTLRDRGKLEEAERVFLDSLDRKRRVFGDDHIDTLYGMDALAQLYHAQSRFEEAERYRRLVLEGRRRALGPDHYETVNAMTGLAWDELSLDKVGEAETLAREALETGRRALGDEHPATRSAMNSVAAILQAQGKNEAAAESFRELLANCRRALGEDRCLGPMNNLAITYSELGRGEEAVPLLEKVLDIQRRKRGDERASTLDAMLNLGAAYTDTGRVDEAAAVMREALETKRRVAGDGDLSTIYLLVNLAELGFKNGTPGEAAPLAEEALEMARRVLGEGNTNTAIAEVTLAEAYSDLQRGDEAEGHCVDGLRVLVKRYGNEHPSTLDARRVLARVRTAQGRFRQAERLFDEVIAAQARVLGADHPDLMETYYSRALLSAARKDRNEALTFLRRAVGGGWADRRIYTEPSLAPMRGNADFDSIVTRVRDKDAERTAKKGTMAGGPS